METVARRRGGGVLESLYKVVMRRNSVYVTFIIAGAFLGERVRYFIFLFNLGNCFLKFFLLRNFSNWLQAVDYGVHKLWETNNVGVMKLLDSILNLIAIYVSCRVICCLFSETINLAAQI